MKILIADDDAGRLADVGEFLKLFKGLRVYTAVDGAEAVRHLVRHQNTELVVASLSLPRSNGLEVLLHLRMGPCKAKGWLMADSVCPRILEQARNLGAEIVLERKFLKLTMFQEVIGSIPN